MTSFIGNMKTFMHKVSSLIPAFAVVALSVSGIRSANAATIAVSSTADSGVGSLRYALASAASGDAIDASGISGTILLTSGEMLISKDVSIIGPGPSSLAVDGNAAGRAFHVTSGSTVIISSLTIIHGSASDD